MSEIDLDTAAITPPTPREMFADADEQLPWLKWKIRYVRLSLGSCLLLGPCLWLDTSCSIIKLENYALLNHKMYNYVYELCSKIPHNIGLYAAIQAFPCVFWTYRDGGCPELLRPTEQLFSRILNNENHVLQSYLPGRPRSVVI